MGNGETPDEVSVDLGTLRFFAEVMKADTDDGLRRGAIRADAEVQTGVRFGTRTLSGEVVAGTDALKAALDRANTNVARQVEAADILIHAMEQILANYTAADMASAEQVATVERTLLDAVKAAEAVYPEPERLPRGLVA
ncbi:hypothetical protein [Catellatospora chokoriensis]|uniref:Uncharacterized protein n=1 Tax=Catellatospora chokoriensis TaxID=310353 RepID=A0A8J3NRY0_9ACTN|nr:hypothetical protein [Catellatospora chokoriensis]GIF90445.1 hypothetical protein Cch02nite_38890 [Catellatospora chokoriensis]